MNSPFWKRVNWSFDQQNFAKFTLNIEKLIQVWLTARFLTDPRCSSTFICSGSIFGGSFLPRSAEIVHLWQEIIKINLTIRSGISDSPARTI